MSDQMSKPLDGSNASLEDQPNGQLEGYPDGRRLECAVTTSNVLPIDTASRTSDYAAIARKARGWGRGYQPSLQDADGRLEFKRICDDLDAEIRQLDAYVVDGVLVDEACGLAADIQELLERMYDCPFGEGESLKSVVVAIQSQLNNAQWTVSHIAFLKAVCQYLRPRWIINDGNVSEIDDLIEEYGLDVFRGTVSDSGTLAKYRIEKVESE